MKLNPLSGASAVLLTLIVLLFQPFEALADSFDFSVLPSSGSVSGVAGATVGWGYTITNDSTADWLVPTNLGADSFSNGTPMLLFDFPVVSPSQTVTQSFDSVSLIGLYEFTWDSGASTGDANDGSFVLNAQWWDADPSGGGNYIADATDQSASYSASLVGSPVPEPRGFVLFVLGAIIIFLAAKPRLLNGPWLDRERYRG